MSKTVLFVKQSVNELGMYYFCRCIRLGSCSGTRGKFYIDNLNFSHDVFERLRHKHVLPQNLDFVIACVSLN